MWFSGLDIGQAQDPTALACVRRITHKPVEGDPYPIYQVLELKQFELGTKYPAIIEAVKKRFESPPLTYTRLAVDYTGVGRPVVDMMRFGEVKAHIYPITITSGHRVTKDVEDEGGRLLNVPKKDFVSTMQLVLQNKQIQISGQLPNASLLAKELENFRVKITDAANETFGAFRQGEHDDMVIAVAMAVWLGERYGDSGVEGISLPREGERNIIESAPKGVFG